MQHEQTIHILKFYLTILLLFAITLANAQLQPSFLKKTKLEGLESNQVYFLHTAKNGLLYIGHGKGISYFDGNVFHYIHNKEFPYTELTNIMETERGEIFGESFNNILFKIENDTLVRLRYYSNSYGFTPSSCYKNTIISYSNDSLFFLNTENNSVSAKPIPTNTTLQQKGPIIFSKLVYFKDKTVMITVDNQFNIELNHLEFKASNLHNTNNQFYILRDKSLDSIYHYNSNHFFSIISKNKNTKVNYISNTDSTTWICTTNGLYYFNHLKGTQTLKYVLPDYNISCVEKTLDNTYVVSTLGEGLLFIPNFEVNKLPNINEKTSALSGFQHKLICGGVTGNLFEYNLTTKQPSYISKNNFSQLIHQIFFDSLTQTLIYSHAFTTFKNKLESFSEPFSLKDFCYVDGQILLGTNSGLYFYSNPNHKSWLNNLVDTTKTNSPYLKKLIPFNEFIATVKYDNVNQKIYLNSYRGIFELSEKDHTPKKLPEPACVLKDMCVYEGKLLLASKDKGILEYDGNSYSPYFKKNAPTGIFLKFEIYKDELWILAEDAIYKYKQHKLSRYDNRYGIPFDKMLNMYTSENSIYVSTRDDILEFPKNLNERKPIQPKFILQNVLSPNTSLRDGSSLDYNKNHIEINFSLIAFANASNTHLAYSINDQTIIHLQNNGRKIILNNLTPDRYTISFYIVEDDIIQTSPVQQFSFTITPPFYKTGWFAILSLLVVLGISYLIFKSILNNWKKENSLKESKFLLEKELDKSMLTSIKAQMNPHFIFNALNTIQSFIYSNDKQSASMYISKFSDLTRSILDMSTKDTITLDEEINSLKLYLELEKMRFEDSFNYTIQQAPSLNKDMIRIPSMLVQPYVENAIKHGLLHKKTNRLLNINFDQLDNHIIITIDDNGIGRKRSQELNQIKNRRHESFAMNANKKRLDILKNTYSDINFDIIDKMSPLGEPLGTKVIIKLPIKSY